MRIFILLLCSLCLLAFAALADVTTSEEQYTYVKKVTFAWVSDAGGGASDTTVYEFTGKVIGLVTVPDGSAAPSDNYDVTVLDADGLDVLAGAGADRDTADIEYVFDESLLGVVVNDRLSLNVSAAGNVKAGTVYVFLR